MKKTFLTIFTLCLVASTCISAYADEKQNVDARKVPSQEQIARRKAHEAAFEQKLGLSEAQKVKAKELRQKGFEKIKPVMDELRAKTAEAEAVKRSRMAVQMQEEKLLQLDEEIKALKKQVNEIRKQNMKDFESILTRKQKKILNEMKKEGRQRFENHQAH